MTKLYTKSDEKLLRSYTKDKPSELKTLKPIYFFSYNENKPI